MYTKVYVFDSVLVPSYVYRSISKTHAKVYGSFDGYGIVFIKHDDWREEYCTNRTYSVSVYKGID